MPPRTSFWGQSLEGTTVNQILGILIFYTSFVIWYLIITKMGILDFELDSLIHIYSKLRQVSALISEEFQFF